MPSINILAEHVQTWLLSLELIIALVNCVSILVSCVSVPAHALYE